MGQASALIEHSAGNEAAAWPFVDFHRLGLAGCIDLLTDPLRRDGTDIRWETPHHRVEIPATAARLLYRAAQVTLENVFKNSEASQVTIRLAAVYHGVRLTITDNGESFNAGTGDSRQHGSNLGPMLLALQKHDGVTTIDSSQGCGTKFTVTLPLD